MENYEVVLAKTVRDLFKSTPLNQIRKYKQNKEKEILKKEDEIKSLILEKYPLLIQSINSFEQISNHLTDLQEIRKVLAKNVEEFRVYKDPEIKDNETFDFEKLFEVMENYEKDCDFDEEKLQDDVDKCWELLRDNKFDNLIIILTQISSRIQSNEILSCNYELLLIEFMNCLIKNTIFLPNCKQIDLDNLLLYSYTIFNCIKDINKLNVSEQYFKLQKNTLINMIIKECFEIDCTENTNIHIKSTFEFFIKLMILRISKLFSEMNNHLDILDIKFNLIQNLSFLINFYISIFNNLRNLDNMSDSSGENMQDEINGNNNVFSINSFLNNLTVLFSIHFEFNARVPNFEEKMKYFLEMIKKELLNNIKLDNDVAFILELVRKLLINLSIDYSFSNQEIICILLPLIGVKQISNNSNLLLFDILYHDYYKDTIKNYLQNNLISCSIENFESGKEESDKLNINDFVLNKIFIFFEDLKQEKTPISIYFKEYLTRISEIIIEFLDKNISYIQLNEGKERRRSFHYDYFAYICDKLFQDSLRNVFNKLGLVSLLDKLSEIQVLFHKVKKEQIEAEIFCNSLSVLKIENFIEYRIESNLIIRSSSTLIDTIYLISTKYFSSANDNDKEIKYNILLALIKFYEEYLNSVDKKIDVYNSNIIYDVLLLQFINEKFQDQANVSFAIKPFPEKLLEDFINSYKGESTLEVEKYKSLIQERIAYSEKDCLNEAFIYEFFFSNDKTLYLKQQICFKKAILQSISEVNKVDKLIHQPEQKTKEKFKEYFVSPHHTRNALSQTEISTIEKNRLKSLTSFKLLSLKMEENFLSIKDETNTKNKQDKSKSTIPQNTINVKNENSGYLGFLGNVIQNNNQSISSLISKFTNFNK